MYPSKKSNRYELTVNYTKLKDRLCKNLQQFTTLERQKESNECTVNAEKEKNRKPETKNGFVIQLIQ